MNDSRPAGAPALCPLPRRGLKRGPLSVLCALLTLSMAMIPLGILPGASPSRAARIGVSVLAVALLLLLSVFLWNVGRPARAVLGMLLLAGAALSLGYASPVPAAALLAFLFAAGIGAFAAATADAASGVWLLLPPILAAAIAAGLLRDPIAPLLCLSPVPAALALAGATRASAGRADGPSRVGALCAASLAAGLTFAGIGALRLYLSLGTLAPSALLGRLDALREGVVSSLSGLALPGGAGRPGRVLTGEEAKDLVNGAFNLLPAFAVTACNLLAAAAQMILYAALSGNGYGASLTPRVRTFRMSPVSGAVFLLSSAVSLAAGSAGSTLWGTVSDNLSSVLTPGLALAGVLRLSLSVLRRKPRRPGCLSVLLLGLPVLLLAAPRLPALYEAAALLLDLSRIRRNRPDPDASPDSGDPGDPEHPGDAQDPPRPPERRAAPFPERS